VIADDVDVRVHRVLLALEVRVIGARTEPDVMRGEVALELQVVVDDLLEDIFLQRDSRSVNPR